MRFPRKSTILLLLLVCFTPLLFFESLHESAMVPRRSWIQLLTLLLLGVSLFTSQSFRSLPKLFCALALIFISFACSVYFAVDSASALLRLSEWATYLLLSCWIASTVDARQIFWILLGASGSATLISLIGIAQFCWGWDYYPQSIAPASTFFNKNFAAEYLVTILPTSFLLIFQSVGRFRFASTGSFLIQISYLLMTRSRASWLGFAISSVLFLYWIRTCGEKKVSLFSSKGKIVAFIFLLGTAIFFALNASTIASDLSRIDSVHQRLVLWTNSLAMGWDHLWFGVGLDNFYVMYPYYHQHLISDTTFTLEKQPHDTHNDLYQIALECGLFGILAFSFFLFQLFKVSKQLVFRKEAILANTTTSLSATLGIVALLGNSLFSFPLRNPTSAMMFWIWSGILFAQSPEFTLKKVKHPLPLTILLLCGFAGSLLLSALSFLGHYHLKQAKLAYYFQHPQPALTHILLADTYFPWDSQIWRDRSMIQSQYSSVWKKNIVLLESIRQKDPYYLNNLINLATMYRKTQQYDQSQQTYETVLRLRPDEFHSLLGMGLLFWEQHRLEEASFWIKKAQQQSPNDPTLLRFLETFPH